MAFLQHHIYIFLTVIGLLGLCIGSFLNVVIYRFPRMNILYPPSFCIHCLTRLPYWTLIPVGSYLALKGKAACCQQKIPLGYPLCELLACILFILLAIHFGLTTKLVFALILISGLITLTFIDIKMLQLPDQITLSLLWLGLGMNFFSVFTDIRSAFFGAIIGFVLFYFLAWVVVKIKSVEGLGEGDMKLLAVLGAWFGWQSLPIILLISSLMGSVIGFLYIFATKQRFSTLIPFGPFLSFAGLCMLFWR